MRIESPSLAEAMPRLSKLETATRPIYPENPGNPPPINDLVDLSNEAQRLIMDERWKSLLAEGPVSR